MMQRKMHNLCPVCGSPAVRSGRTYCSRACYNLARSHTATCVVCGKVFFKPPSADTVTCSRACSIANRKRHAQNPEQYEKMLESKAFLPIFQPDERHMNAKCWVIQAPDGHIYRCRNLKHWLRQHEDMLDGTVQQAWDGITKIKYSMQGKRRHPCYTWKGWKLLSYDDAKAEDK